MRWIFVLAAMAVAQSAQAQPITSAECRAMEGSMAAVASDMARMVESHRTLARGMAMILSKSQERTQLGDAAVQVAVHASQSMAAQERLLRALQDMQQQFRLCSRDP